MNDEELKLCMEDHAIANEIYRQIVEILIGKDVKHAKMALAKVEFNLFCVTDE
jgi:hypothetical protein